MLKHAREKAQAYEKMHLRSVCVSTEKYCELWREATQSVTYKMTVWKDRATHLLLICPLDLLSVLGLHVFLYVCFGEVCVRVVRGFI